MITFCREVSLFVMKLQTCCSEMWSGVWSSGCSEFRRCLKKQEIGGVATDETTSEQASEEIRGCMSDGR